MNRITILITLFGVAVCTPAMAGSFTSVCATPETAITSSVRWLASDPSPVKLYAVKGAGAVRLASAAETINFLSPGSSIRFYYTGSADEMHLVACLHVPEGDGPSRAIYVGAIEPEGGEPPVISDLFLADADHIPGRELLMTVRWRVYHRGLDTEGNLYRTYVFSGDGRQGPGGLSRLCEVEKRIGSGFDGVMEGEETVCPYKDATSIRPLLQNLGR